MKIEEGRFYFISEKFFDKFKEYNLMLNKENGNKRPCFFCFKDRKNENIIWFIPISSKADKYKEIHDKKKLKQKKVYNFVFGNVLGKEKAFLIQNIFPTTQKYIEDKYITNNMDVRISQGLQREVIGISNKVIALAEKGINIPFYDIIKMRTILIDEL